MIGSLFSLKIGQHNEKGYLSAIRNSKFGEDCGSQSSVGLNAWEGIFKRWALLADQHLRPAFPEFFFHGDEQKAGGAKTPGSPASAETSISESAVVIVPPD
jgi:hypothetical protein